MFNQNNIWRAISSVNDREYLFNWLFNYGGWLYRWRNGKMIFLYPFEESRMRKVIHDAGMKHLGERFIANNLT